MATPQPKSYEQILGDMLRAYQSKTGINDLNTGSAVTSFYETVALAIARSSGDVFQILRDLSVDRARGDALKKIAIDEGLRELPARVATGEITITDTSFTKKSTKIYAGANAPNVGSTTILVADALNFPSSGSVYIGRGTPNIEGPINYTSKTQIGGYWSLALSSATTKFHNINESVVLAQGGVRNINIGVIAIAPATGANPDIKFTVIKNAVILDGETEVAGVLVSAQEPGVIGNVPIGAIKEFNAEPFSGAKPTNPLPFKTGRDVETDDELRIRIKRARLSRGLGTALAVKNAVINASPVDENATIVSSEIVTESGGMTTLYVDDGTGYEPKTNGVGIEVLVDSALGGETNFQLKTGGRQTSVSKAFLISNLNGPFDIKGTDKLAISIGGTTTEHTFSTSDFISPGGATAYEIAASINANTSLNFNALTSDGGAKVILTAKTEKNEAIKTQGVTSGRDAANALGLPSNEVQTLRLFKNKIPLNKDGLDATVQSEKQTNWSISITDGDTLKLSVDGTASITYIIQDADFIAEGSYTTASSQNSLESWANVLNNKLTGVTATVVGERLVITSNLGESDRAAISIDPTSTLVTKGMFTQSAGLEAFGQDSDYQLSRNTAQIRLKTPLISGDSLTAGTNDTEARVESVRILGGNLTLVSDAYFWLLLDDPTVQSVFTGVTTGTTLTVSKPSANIVRYTSNATNAFSNVFVGDYVIIWSKEVSPGNRLEGRVCAKTSSTLDIKITASEHTAVTIEGPVIYQDGFVVIRTKKVPQKFKIGSGTSKFLGTIADELNLQANGCEFSVFDEEILLIKTLTKNTSGAVFIVTQDDQAKSLSLPTNELKLSSESLYAFYESEYTEGDFPLFVHSNFSTESFASPPDSYVSSISTGITLLNEGLDPDFIVGYLQPYGTILDALSPSETTPLLNYSGSSITIDQDKLIKRLRLSDRWYAASPLNFGANDEIVIVLDNDLSGKTFPIPLYRNVKTVSTLANNPNAFNAVDADAGDLSFLTYFPSSFKFDNYKVLMKAKAILNPAGNENAVLFRAVQYGRSGEKINVSYIYPTTQNSALSSSITVDENVNIKISLSSGGAIGTSIDGTTEWNVTIVPNTPVAGTDQVTYSWTTTGANPALSLSGGEYVNIGTNSQLDLRNTGTFRISTVVGFAPTSTSFTVSRKTGEAVAESNKATLVNNNFSFYNKSTTNGLDIRDYVNANLYNFITAELIDDSGLTGAGFIEKSTHEESGFTYESVSLKDGLNWIASTNLSGSPQFTFKIPLTVYDTATAGGTYGFNNNEEIKFIPTNLEQLVKFINTLAITGYTTVGSAIASQRGGKLELSTQVLGGSGAVQIVGGKANTTETPILGSSSIYNNQYILSGIDKSGIDGLHSDQWVKLQASNTQKKNTLFKSSLNIQIQSDTPPATGSDPKKSTITLFNKTLEDRHFGKPRHHLRTRGRTFKVEKQGKLTCVSWNQSGTQPFFQKSINFNDALGGTVSVEKITGTSIAEYEILSGNANFSEASIGDYITVQNMSNSLNNGTFLITGISDDGKIMRLFNPYGVTSAGSAFTAGDFSCTTELSENDTIIIKQPFNVLNQGKFRVIRRYGNSFYIENPNSVEESVTDSYTAVSINFDSTTEFDIDASENKIKLSWSGVGTEPDFSSVRPGDEITLGSDFNSSNQGSWVVFNSEDTFLEAINASAVSESGILISDVLEIHRPSFTVFEYDATVPDDLFTISGDFLGSNNKNSWKVHEVLGPNKIVVYGTMTSVSTTSVSGQQDNLIVQEWTPFVGYKKIHLVTVDPASINQRGILVFDTVNQADKINEAAAVQISAIGKLEFDETIRRGLDSYRFDTGIIGEANRIVYGEPRDVTSYPGVAAAGAEIFIRPPLIKRVQVGIAVRLETGIPFFQIVEQVRTNVSALINGNPIGTPIAISDIVSVVNVIPGVKAMAITSPLYNATNDTINIGPSEKAKIIDPTNDISTTQIG